MPERDGFMTVDVDLVKEALREVLAEPCSIGSDIHRQQHEFLTETIPLLRDFLAYRAVRMEQIQRRNAMWMKARDSAVGFFAVSVVMAVLGALGWVGNLVIQQGINAVQHGGHGP